MTALLLALRLILIAVLAVAGVAKLADRDGARSAVTGFGVPAAISGPLATLLWASELAAAALLAIDATAGVGAALALALMVCFCAAIARSLARGEAPECHCFGALHSEPAGARTLARNALLAAAAASVVVGGPGASPTGVIAGVHAGGGVVVALAAALVAVLAGGAALVLRLLRRQGELLLRVDELEDALESSGLIVGESHAPAATAGLPVGTPAPEFTLPALDGDAVALADLRSGADPVLLVFSDPACGPCSALMPQVAAWQRERPGGLRPVLVSRGEVAANRAHATEHGLTDILLQADREVSESFAVSGTPSAVIVAADGTITSAVHAGEDQIRALIAGYGQDVVLPIHHAAAPDVAPPATPGPGDLAPDPALRTLDGKLVRLSARLAQREAMVVFWNPDCGFCERMLDDLRGLDARHDGLVVISTGSVPANRALALRAPVLLDDGFAAGTAFGAMGTPSAVLIDEHGRIGSAVAVGREAVLALAPRAALAA